MAADDITNLSFPGCLDSYRTSLHSRLEMKTHTSFPFCRSVSDHKILIMLVTSCSFKLCLNSDESNKKIDSALCRRLMVACIVIVFLGPSGINAKSHVELLFELFTDEGPAERGCHALEDGCHVLIFNGITANQPSEIR